MNDNDLVNNELIILIVISFLSLIFYECDCQSTTSFNYFVGTYAITSRDKNDDSDVGLRPLVSSL